MILIFSIYLVVYYTASSNEYEGQAPDLFFCGSWDLGQLSLSHLLPTLFLPLYPALCYWPTAFPKALLQRQGFKLYYLFLISQSVSANNWANNRGYSLGYPRFLLLLLLPVALPLFALICPECSATTGRGSLSRSAIVARAINTLAPTRGFEVKAWLQSIHYQTNNISLSRQPGNHKTRGIPAFVPFDEEWQLNRFNLMCSWKHTKLGPHLRVTEANQSLRYDAQ